MGMVAIHVDDILYAGTKSLPNVDVEVLGDSLPTKNLGEVRFFLGCAFIRDREAGTIEILKRVTSRVFSRDLIIVAPARSLLPLPTITGP